MNDVEYVDKVQVTNGPNYDEVRNRLKDNPNIDLLHSAIGISTESGEVSDIMKKYIFYGKEIDKTNFKEELGDLFWYIGLACRTLDISFEEVWITNINKLKARYGNKFSEEKALNRDLDLEREVLIK